MGTPLFASQSVTRRVNIFQGAQRGFKRASINFRASGDIQSGFKAFQDGFQGSSLEFKVATRVSAWASGDFKGVSDALQYGIMRFRGFRRKFLEVLEGSTCFQMSFRGLQGLSEAFQGYFWGFTVEFQRLKGASQVSFKSVSRRYMGFQWGSLEFQIASQAFRRSSMAFQKKALWAFSETLRHWTHHLTTAWGEFQDSIREVCLKRVLLEGELQRSSNFPSSPWGFLVDFRDMEVSENDSRFFRLASCFFRVSRWNTQMSLISLSYLPEFPHIPWINLA